ncbi:MAG: helix-turn-helix domain-containing protein [Promethearchaeota archaeon]
MVSGRSQQQTQSGLEEKTKSISTQKPEATLGIKEYIIKLLRTKGTLTRGEITTLSGIPRTSVYDTLTKLLLLGVVEKYIDRDGRRGRPRIYYQLAVE